MKFASILSFFALVTSVFGLSNPIITARQFRTRRGLPNVDVCAALDTDLKIDDPLLEGLPIVVGHLDVCLCISAVRVFIQANAVARLAVLILGEDEVVALITALINSAPGHETCHYPAHSTPLCSNHNPCDFHCTDGFERFPLNSDKPTSCICPAPQIECNGRCGNFPQGCGTAAPAPPRKRCEPGYDLCGIPTGRSQDWECVDTKRDLESCGGCVVPHSSDADRLSRRGNDCSAIPYVASVYCEDNVCHVESCIAGYVPSPKADACIAVAAGGSRVKRNSRVAKRHVRDPTARIDAGVKVDADHIGNVDAKGTIKVDI